MHKAKTICPVEMLTTSNAGEKGLEGAAPIPASNDAMKNYSLDNLSFAITHIENSLFLSLVIVFLAPSEAQ